MGPPFDPQMGTRGVKWGSKVLFAPIFTKFGGKKPFCMLLKDLFLLFEQFTLGPHLTPKRGWGGSNGGQMGVKSHFCPNLHQIWWEDAILPFIERSFFIFYIFFFWPPIWPPKGVKGGQMGVKSHFCSNLHQIWWEDAILLVIERSFNIFLNIFLCAPHLTPKSGQGGSNGGQKWFLLQSSGKDLPVLSFDQSLLKSLLNGKLRDNHKIWEE